MKANDTITEALTVRPACDFCGAAATVDGATRMGPWAYMCASHFEQYGVGLGMGVGQRIVIPKEAASDELDAA
jgi:hypothetical protein